MTESEMLPEGTLRGMPGPLPRGERLLWQGAPTVSGILVRALHARLVALWFAVAALVSAGNAVAEGSALSALPAAAPTLAIGAGAIGLLAALAWLVHRTTVYSITDRRIVMHVGIALPITLNLPFAKVDGAGLALFSDGSGDLPVQLHAGNRVAYLQLWPHARPWHVTRPEPMMRCVPDAQRVAALLARAMAAHAGHEEEASQPVVVARPRAATMPGRLAAAR